jgi:SAM-dependent methyltransferase
VTMQMDTPYGRVELEPLRSGVADDDAISVLVDGACGFAALHPRPRVDYERYVPRQKRLGLADYRKRQNVVERRHARIADWFANARSVIEIGCSDGAFLALLKAERDELALVGIEPDQHTRAARMGVGLAHDFGSVDDAVRAGITADIVCLFHVFEHIEEPAPFLAGAARLLNPGGRLVIEVPSLDDPLLSLYRCEAYEAFYFQRQHPYVYSARSLTRTLEVNGWRVLETRPYQRYGLENHLAWLTAGKPGGDERFAAVFSAMDATYRATLERSGHADTVFAIATPQR